MAPAVPAGTTATTDANGFYQFLNLAPGSYTVSEAQPAGYIDGKDTVGSTGGSNAVNDVLSGITLVSGANSIENNFGELVAAQINGFVYVDGGSLKKPQKADASALPALPDPAPLALSCCSRASTRRSSSASSRSTGSSSS